MLLYTNNSFISRITLTVIRKPVVHMAMYRQFKEKTSSSSEVSASAGAFSTSTNTNEAPEQPKKSKQKDGVEKKTHDVHIPKSVKSAVALIPPESVWKQINDIRRVHDKSFKRWMAHINLLYPFIPDVRHGADFTEAASKIKDQLSSIQPFTVCFPKHSFGYFKHSKSCTMWLKPLLPDQEESETEADVLEKTVDQINKQEEIALKQEARKEKKQKLKEQPDDIEAAGLFTETAGCSSDQTVEEKSDNKEQPETSTGKKSKRKKQKEKPPSPPTKQNFHPSVLELQSKLEELYPDFKDLSTISEWGFQPHLSLGQFKANVVETMMKEFQESWTDVEFEVKEIYLISRENFEDPFHIRHSIPLAYKSETA